MFYEDYGQPDGRASRGRWSVIVAWPCVLYLVLLPACFLLCLWFLPSSLFPLWLLLLFLPLLLLLLLPLLLLLLPLLLFLLLLLLLSLLSSCLFFHCCWCCCSGRCRFRCFSVAASTVGVAAAAAVVSAPAICWFCFYYCCTLKGSDGCRSRF